MSVIELDNKEYSRKVTRVGNSIGITIPNEFVQDQGIQPGDEYRVIVNDQGDIILRRATRIPENVRPEVLNLFAETFLEYEDVLRTLRDK
jgi:antitoxin MazE